MKDKQPASASGSSSSQPKVKDVLNVEQRKKAKLSATKTDQINNALCELIIDASLPLSLVRNPMFNTFTSLLDQRYEPPGDKGIKTRIQRMYFATKAVLHEILQAVEFVSITHDCWTSIATVAYDTTTVDFITSDWKLKVAVLSTTELTGSHTSENIASSLFKTKTAWALRNNPICVTDNAANEAKAIETVLAWQRLGCSGHRMNLVMKDGLDLPEARKVVSKGTNMVSFFHRSPQATTVLRKQQVANTPVSEEGSEAVPRQLIQYVKTHWNTATDMMKRLLEETQSLHATAFDLTLLPKARQEIQTHLYTFDEQQTADSLVTILEPFKTATEILSSETQPTLPSVLPVLIKLQRVLIDHTSDSATIQKIKAAMRKSMDKKILSKDDRNILRMGSILSPAMKQMNFLDDEERSLARGELRDAMHEVDITTLPITKIKQEPTAYTVAEETQPQPGPSIVTPPPLPSLPVPPPEAKSDAEPEPPLKRVKKEKPTAQDWLSDVLITGVTPAPTISEQVDVELDRYMSDQTKGEDLAWWCLNEGKYPRLSRLARRYLAVPASSVPSERIFSLAGQIVNKKRSCLSTSLVDQLIFLKKNKDFSPK